MRTFGILGRLQKRFNYSETILLPSVDVESNGVKSIETSVVKEHFSKYIYIYIYIFVQTRAQESIIPFSSNLSYPRNDIIRSLNATSPQAASQVR